jgi:D-glycero-alpha-D-manno-heptose 1-phosphate guanylyltransferase
MRSDPVLPGCAIVLAGGLGTRLRSAVPDLPKPMAPIDGRPFLAHQLDHWIDQGIAHFVLAVGYQHEAISGWFGERYRDATIGYAVEASPLGTGGALLAAAHRLPQAHRGAPLLVLNGDTYFDVDLAALAGFAAARDADWCLALFRADEPGRYMGLAVAPDGRIGALRHDDQSRGRLANGGVYLVRPGALARPAGAPASGPVSLEAELFPAWLAEGRRFHGMACDGAFIDIGVPADYLRAAAVLPRRADALARSDPR